MISLYFHVGSSNCIPPSNDEVTFVSLWLNETYLETIVFNAEDGAVEFSSIDSSFFFTDGMAMTLADCYISDNYPFEVVCFQDFFDSNYITDEDTFQYEVNGTGNDLLKLTLTSPEGIRQFTEMPYWLTMILRKLILPYSQIWLPKRLICIQKLFMVLSKSNF